jgi:hypothetical protein
MTCHNASLPFWCVPSGFSIGYVHFSREHPLSSPCHPAGHNRENAEENSRGIPGLKPE